MSLRALLPCSTVLLVLAAGTAVAGDASYRSANHWSLRLPEGWERVDDAVVRQVTRLAAQATRLPSQSYEAAFQRADAEHPFAFPYVLVRYEAGSTSGAYRDLERQIDKGVEEVKAKHGKALEDLLGDFSFEKPKVDKVRHRVWITMNADTPTEGAMRCFLAAHLGSEGVAQLAYYTHAEDAEAGFREFVALSDSLAFDDGYGFRGAGIFDGLWGKALIGAGLGALVGLVRLLGRRRAAPAPAPLSAWGPRDAVAPPATPQDDVAPAFRYVSARPRPGEPVGGPRT